MKLGRLASLEVRLPFQAANSLETAVKQATSMSLSRAILDLENKNKWYGTTISVWNAILLRKKEWNLILTWKEKYFPQVHFCFLSVNTVQWERHPTSAKAEQSPQHVNHPEEKKTVWQLNPDPWNMCRFGFVSICIHSFTFCCLFLFKDKDYDTGGGEGKVGEEYTPDRS